MTSCPKLLTEQAHNPKFYTSYKNNGSDNSNGLVIVAHNRSKLMIMMLLTTMMMMMMMMITITQTPERPSKSDNLGLCWHVVAVETNAAGFANMKHLS